MTMATSYDRFNEDGVGTHVKEPTISFMVQQTTDLFDKHYNPDASVESGMSLQEGFDVLRSRIEDKIHEKNRIVS